MNPIEQSIMQYRLKEVNANRSQNLIKFFRDRLMAHTTLCDYCIHRSEEGSKEKCELIMPENALPRYTYLDWEFKR